MPCCSSLVPASTLNTNSLQHKTPVVGRGVLICAAGKSGNKLVAEPAIKFQKLCCQSPTLNRAERKVGNSFPSPSARLLELQSKHWKRGKWRKWTTWKPQFKGLSSCCNQSFRFAYKLTCVHPNHLAPNCIFEVNFSVLLRPANSHPDLLG